VSRFFERSSGMLVARSHVLTIMGNVMLGSPVHVDGQIGGVMQASVNVEQLLVAAANAAVDQEVPIEVFTLAALAAYLQADPELAARLRDGALLEHFEELRRGGRLPVA
jgi:hypothetical protein